MKPLKQLFNFYLNASIHVSLAVCALCLITVEAFGLALDANLLWFVFFASITGYNFVKYYGLAKFHHRSLTNRLKVIQLFSLFCFLGLCWFALQLPFKTLLYAGGLGVVTFLYAIPFLPKRFFMDKRQNLRDLGGLKVYVIALVWASVAVLLPVLHLGRELSLDVWVLCFQVFVFVVVLMLPFEIRDLQFDSLRLATIPQKIGIQRTKIFGTLLLIVFVLAECFKAENTPEQWLAVSVTALVSGLVLWFLKEEQNDYYCAFWVEGIPVLWWAIVAILY